MATSQLVASGLSCLTSLSTSSSSSVKAIPSSGFVSKPAFPFQLRPVNLNGKQSSLQSRTLKTSCQTRISDTKYSDDGKEECSKWETVGKGLVVLAATAGILFSNSQDFRVLADEEFQIYYGTAASASSYGGYGGNASKRDSAEYLYDVPSGWKERNISKVEKGTNGTDSEFFNPKKRTEKVYVTFLAGFRRLPPQESVLTNLALSDVNLQDQIASADEVVQSKREENGQLYYDFEIDSPVGHSLISVTCTNNKLYAHFVNAPPPDWSRDQSTLRHIHESFKTTV